MEPRYDTSGNWTVTSRGTSSTYYYTPRYWRVDATGSRNYSYNAFGEQYECLNKIRKPAKAEDWSKSKEVDEFLEGFEVK